MAASKVYFSPVTEGEATESIQKKVSALFDIAGFAECIQERDLVGVKTHFGEKGNVTHVSPDYVRAVVEKVLVCKGNPFLMDSNTLYSGQRANSPDHIRVATEHGFTLDRTGAPLIIVGGLFGNDDTTLPVNGKHYKEVSVVKDLDRINSLMVVSHVTGHVVSGLGATLKNIGMGMASRRGKLDQHSDVKPFVLVQDCRACKACVEVCPVSAISMVDGKAKIDEAKCIGCGECLCSCRYEAIGFNWGRTSVELQEKMIEHATAILNSKKGRFGFFNFLTNITKDCDCIGGIAGREGIIVKAIGILASKDPLAIDVAALDLFKKNTGKSLCEMSYPHLDSKYQIDHAVAMGIGSAQYELIPC